MSSSAETNNVKEMVQSQFGQAAANYVTSPIHASGPDLAVMVDSAKLTGDEHLLDAGCATGHTALAFAPHVASVVGIDLADSMLDQARHQATLRAISNVEFRQGDVEHLPVETGSFDIVTSRLSAHHWPNPLAALQEFRRVLRPHGKLLLGDTVSWQDFVVDTHFQAIELLRDPSHVRDHTIPQWLSLLNAAGFEAQVTYQWQIQIEFDSWIKRINTPPQHAAMIRTLLAEAPSEVKSRLRVQPDTSFTIQAALFYASPRT